MSTSGAASVPARSVTQPAFHPAIAAKAALLGTLGVWMFAAPGLMLFAEWTQRPALSHGLLVIAAAVLVLWFARSRVTVSAPDSRGLLLIAAACLIYVAGLGAVELFLTRVSAIFLLAGILWTFAGLRLMWACTPALLLAASAIPLPAVLFNALIRPVQIFSGSVAASIAHAAGWSTLFDGSSIDVPQLHYALGEICSGYQALPALVMLALAWRPRAWFIALPLALAAATALVTLRIIAIAGLAENNSDAARTLHNATASWLIFLLGAGVLAAGFRLWPARRSAL